MVKDFLQSLKQCNNEFAAKKPEAQRRVLDILAKASKDILKFDKDSFTRKIGQKAFVIPKKATIGFETQDKPLEETPVVVENEQIEPMEV